MNPYTGAVYADLDDAVSHGEELDDIVQVTGNRAAVDELISKVQAADKAKIEKRRQTEKNRRNAAQASRKKNRKK